MSYFTTPSRAGSTMANLSFPEKQMIVDVDHFPLVMVSMVDAFLPKDKGKEKVEFILMLFVLKRNSQPRLKIDLSTNESPKYFSNPVYVESMLDSSA